MSHLLLNYAHQATQTPTNIAQADLGLVGIDGASFAAETWYHGLPALDREASCELKRLIYDLLSGKCAAQDIATSKFVGKSIVDVISTVCFDVEAKQLQMSDGCNRIYRYSNCTWTVPGFGWVLRASASSEKLCSLLAWHCTARVPLTWPDVDVV